MKLLKATTAAGIEIVSAFVVGPTVIDATFAEEPWQILGSFAVAMNANAKLEIVGYVPFGGTGIVVLYNATPGEVEGSREVLRSSITSTSEQRRLTQAVELVAGKIYQIRATCTDPSYVGKTFALQSVQVVDS